MVGVAGIMTREAEKTSKSAANLAVAFQDLDALMDMAAEMVKLAEKFRGVMGADGAITLSPTPASSSSSLSSMSGIAPSGSGGGSDAAAAGGGSSSSEQLLLDSETQLQLIAMGITSPVTRASAGVRYHQELARQLADFLSGPLARAGGVMLLPDVYCLFNRARGTELVSPDDLLQACDAFTQVGHSG
jgi:ESCRT-II complex subunit VPS36